MEEVLDIYTRPHDPGKPLVCLDESSKQLVSETRTPLPMTPGQPQRVDYEYERNGTANLFMLFAPLEGWRHVEVTERRLLVAISKHRSVARASIMPASSKTYRTSTSRTPRKSFWFRTISIPMSRPRFTKHSRPPKPGDWPSASSGITHPSMAVG
jgi:hypothetical protein